VVLLLALFALALGCTSSPATTGNPAKSVLNAFTTQCPAFTQLNPTYLFAVQFSLTAPAIIKGARFLEQCSGIALWHSDGTISGGGEVAPIAAIDLGSLQGSFTSGSPFIWSEIDFSVPLSLVPGNYALGVRCNQAWDNVAPGTFPLTSSDGTVSWQFVGTYNKASAASGEILTVFPGTATAPYTAGDVLFQQQYRYYFEPVFVDALGGGTE